MGHSAAPCWNCHYQRRQRAAFSGDSSSYLSNPRRITITSGFGAVVVPVSSIFQISLGPTQMQSSSFRRLSKETPKCVMLKLDAPEMHVVWGFRSDKAMSFFRKAFNQCILPIFIPCQFFDNEIFKAMPY